jgi:hypothetical protein
LTWGEWGVGTLGPTHDEVEEDLEEEENLEEAEDLEEAEVWVDFVERRSTWNLQVDRLKLSLLSGE